ncbi:glycosyltransferase [Burkholderia contaminans]|uniref:glycosyltransferase n=1 Tax=Burkholderia contaminans TaxID=488447 RepID=UPI00145420DA|nr:glycosyltransferase [Burkholderia contaminans]MCA8154889.1 glycosyltransferase [Burkholderia contaminans]VWD34312.1 glycosyl transferase family 1 [Burkholderia contaminans]
MNIAIVAPSHVPFALGGAERLWTNLCGAINNTAGLQADIIKLPAHEGNFWQIVDSYREFYRLDLSHFDQVITGKNPTWMIRHPNHVVYMLHPLRGVYDTYHLFHLPNTVNSSNPKINTISRACESGVATEELFEMVDDLRLIDGIDESELALPSPFLRAVIHRLDANAMKGVRRFAAISETVAARREYFHGATDVRVICPPSDLPVRSEPARKYFFTYSRLDEAKRIDLIVSAFRKLDLDFELRIAGVGGALERLKELAGSDNRIKFLGRLSEERLVEELGAAYAVPFVPYEEDYGLVAIEALRAGKPLITCKDSGGPTEFVVDGRNGFVADPSVESLCNAMERCIRTPAYSTLVEAAKMSVSNISWKHVVEHLVPQQKIPTVMPQRRMRLVSLSTYPIYPPKGGGQARVFYLCRELSKNFDVHTVCLVDGAQQHEIHQVSEHFTVEYVPADKGYCEKDWALYQTGGIPTTDVSMVAYYDEAPSFVCAARNAMANADVVVAEQAYTYVLLEKYAKDQIRVYNSQNIEYVLKQQMFRDSVVKDTVIALTEKAERLACEDADLIVYCSEADKIGMERIYSVAQGKRAVIVENGAAGETISYMTSSARRDLKNRIAPGKSVGIFVASWHQPNIEAVRDLDRIATLTPDILYIVVGSVGGYFKDNNEIMSENIVFTGLVTEQEKDILLQLADVALNPMSTGSGTNIKMFDYMAAGLPLVTTEVGARGIDLPEGFADVISIEDFPTAIQRAVRTPRNIQKRIFVEEKYDWRAVSARYINEVVKCVERKLA